MTIVLDVSEDKRRRHGSRKKKLLRIHAGPFAEVIGD
jgi:hypothetical protein